MPARRDSSRLREPQQGVCVAVLGDIRRFMRGHAQPLVRVMMLALGVLAMPSAGQVLLYNPHCAPHNDSIQPVHDGGMHGMASQPTPMWQSASPHQCPHCPASECARIPPCSSGSSSLIAATAPVSATVSAGRRWVRPFDDSAHSVLQQPPTPPPLLVS